MGKDRVGTSFKPDKTFFQKLIYRSSNIKKSDAITVILHSFYFISDLLSDCLIFSVSFYHSVAPRYRNFWYEYYSLRI